MESPLDSLPPSQSRLQSHKRLRWCAWHRGCRELDLLLGPFADAHLERLSAADQALFAALLEKSDAFLMDYFFLGRLPESDQKFGPLLAWIREHGSRDPPRDPPRDPKGAGVTL